MERRPYLLSLLFLAACATSDEHVNHPSPPKAERVAAMPVLPAKAADKSSAAEPAKPVQNAVPMVRMGSTPMRSATAAGSERAERFAALESEHEKLMDEYYELFLMAKTDEERQEIAKTTQAPDPAPFLERAKALLTENTKDETALAAIGWLFQQVGERERRGELCALLEAHHFDSPAIGDLLAAIANAGPSGTSLVEKLADKSPHESIRGRAMLQLGDRAMEDRRYAARLKTMEDPEERASFEEYFGKERCAELLALDAATADSRAIAIFERIEKDFGSVKLREGTPYETTLAQTAASNLFEIEHLGIGKVAPDIEGEDIAGVPFKLSDYRGNVVMLDFWGFW